MPLDEGARDAWDDACDDASDDAWDDAIEDSDLNVRSPSAPPCMTSSAPLHEASLPSIRRPTRRCRRKDERGVGGRRRRRDGDVEVCWDESSGDDVDVDVDAVDDDDDAVVVAVDAPDDAPDVPSTASPSHPLPSPRPPHLPLMTSCCSVRATSPAVDGGGRLAC